MYVKHTFTITHKEKRESKLVFYAQSTSAGVSLIRAIRKKNGGVKKGVSHPHIHVHMLQNCTILQNHMNSGTHLQNCLKHQEYLLCWHLAEHQPLVSHSRLSPFCWNDRRHSAAQAGGRLLLISCWNPWATFWRSKVIIWNTQELPSFRIMTPQVPADKYGVYRISACNKRMDIYCSYDLSSFCLVNTPKRYLARRKYYFDDLFL